MRAKLLGAVLAALIVPFAYAGDITQPGKIASPSQAVAQEPNWTGFHIDASAGYGFTRSEYDAIGAGTGTLNADNALLTLGFGWDAQISNMVLGVVADVTASDFTGDTQWQWFIGARAGVLLTPRTLVYALAGYTETIDGNLAILDAVDLKDIAGLTVGGGLEHMFGSGWSAKAEYRYVSFGREHAPNGVFDGLVDGSAIDTGEHTVRLGISKRF
jgi:outer membrane immunogenic protein